MDTPLWRVTEKLPKGETAFGFRNKEDRKRGWRARAKALDFVERRMELATDFVRKKYQVKNVLKCKGLH